MSTYRGRRVVVAILGPLMTTFRRGRKMIAGLVVVLGAAPNRHCLRIYGTLGLFTELRGIWSDI